MTGLARNGGPLFLHITSTPAGEAPLWVREQWVGLTLPLATQDAAPARWLVSGVLSGPRTTLAWLLALVRGRFTRHRGYAVDTRAALAALALQSPEAHGWWRENLPHVTQPGHRFVFEAAAGHVGEAAAETRTK